MHVNIADHNGVFCINNDSELFSRNATKSKRELKKDRAQFDKSLINESWDYAYYSDFKSVGECLSVLFVVCSHVVC